MEIIDNETIILKETPQYAGFWNRFAAFVIDTVIITFLTTSIKRNILNYFLVKFEPEFGFNKAEAISEPIWLFALVIIRWCYFAGMESSPLKSTLGKLAVGIYVVDIEEQRLTFGKASLRHFGKFLSSAMLGIGYIIAGFNIKKQAFHDILSNCLLLRK